MPADFDVLKNEKYISLETFKKDGNGVKTPVWFVERDGQILFFTDGTSFKVKRLSRNSKARVAACDMRGTVSGPWFEATAEVVPPGTPLEKTAYDLLGKRYGMQISALNFFSRLFGRMDRRRVIVVKPA